MTTTTQTNNNSGNHGGIGIGAKFGPLFPTFNSEDPADTFDNRTGWIGGLFIGGNRPGLLGVGVDILYARKKFADPDTGTEAKFDYLEVPILLRVNIGSHNLNRVNVYAVVGPAIDWRLNSTLSTGESITDQTSGVDVGVSVGGGVEITRFIIEGRYTKGLRNILNSAGLTNTSIKTNAFAVMFGFRFN